MGFFFTIDTEKLMQLLEIKLTKVWGLSMLVSLWRFLKKYFYYIFEVAHMNNMRGLQ
jgi:hypothetical protein